MIHELKIKQEFAEEYFKGNKPWEIRKNDRDFKVGDSIEFTIIEGGLKYSRDIAYIFQGGEYGLDKDYCVITLKDRVYKLLCYWCKKPKNTNKGYLFKDLFICNKCNLEHDVV